jgi:deazaflavin-dependent oxidoreductase (nitroreductase family)
MSDEDETGLADRLFTAVASSKPVSWFYVNVGPHLDRAVLRLSGGRLTMSGRRTVGFLYVKGAKSGVERVTPLMYTRDGERIVVIASRGGDSKHPAWYRNVVANPDVRFEIGGDGHAYHARELEGEERERAWKLAVRRYGGYAVYQRRAGERRIPVLMLEPSE